MLKQAHLYIKGDVISVGFRAWTKIQAKINNVTGWVRNVFDKENVFGVGGGVEAVIQGEEKNVNTMVEVLKKGPPVARVDDVDILWQDVKEIMDEFEIRK